MNVFLIIVLVLSGLIELVVGLCALLVSTGATTLWLTGTYDMSGPLGILTFVLGLAAIYLAALHVTAIRWLQMEKQEGYPLSIAVGIALAVLGVATYAYTALGAAQIGQWTYLIILQAVQGIVLGLVGIAAMRAPATVRELSIPGRHERSVGRLRREASRQGRESRTRRTDEDERLSRRSGHRRRSARRDTSRPSRQRPEGHQPRGGSSDRRERRRERTPVASRESANGSPEATDALRRRPLSSRGEGTDERDRRSLRRPRAPELPETADARSLGVVVTGKRPDAGSMGPSEEETRPRRPEPGRGREEKTQRPLAPMVPSLRMEDGKSRRSEREESDTERGDRGAHPRSRHRRHRSSSRESRDREQIVGRSDRREEHLDRASTVSVDSEPSGNRFVRNGGRRSDPGDFSSDREVRDLPRRQIPESDRADVELPAVASESAPLPEEPIDRISAFHALDERQMEERDDGDNSAFGRQRRPFTPHRRARQVKPRESKVRQSLGGDQTREPGEDLPDPPFVQPESRERRVTMENGIGPIDLDEPDSSEED